LAARWLWGQAKVHRFVAVLKTDSMAIRETIHGASMLLIVNYELYQGCDSESESAANLESNQR
jgi:hypothetical protein